MAINDNTKSDACLVDKFIGSAYDTVKYVADNLDAIIQALEVSNNQHDGLTNRDLANQHPQSAITGLAADLQTLSDGITGITTLFDQHVALTTQHFEDAPADDQAYVRKNEDWVNLINLPVASHTHDGVYDPAGSAAAVEAKLDAHTHGSDYDPLGAADTVRTELKADIAALQSDLDTHNHDSQYDALGSASAVEDNLQAQIDALDGSVSDHNHDDRYLQKNMLNSGTVLPSPDGYPEGAYFAVTES